MGSPGHIIDRQGKFRKLSLNSRLREGEVQVEICEDKSLILGFHKSEECSLRRKRKVIRFPINKEQLVQLTKIISK